MDGLLIEFFIELSIGFSCVHKFLEIGKVLYGEQSPEHPSPKNQTSTLKTNKTQNGYSPKQANN